MVADDLISQLVQPSDPTALTTDALNRAMTAIREVIDDKVLERQRAAGDLKELLVVRIDSEIRVLLEKFKAVAQQISERDVRGEREARDSKMALDAAFAAQKEAAAEAEKSNAKAIDKSERTTSETIKTNEAKAVAANETLTKSLDEVKTRLTAVESERRGGQSMLAGIYALGGFLVALIIIGGLVAAAGGF